MPADRCRLPGAAPSFKSDEETGFCEDVIKYYWKFRWEKESNADLFKFVGNRLRDAGSHICSAMLVFNGPKPTMIHSG